MKINLEAYVHMLVQTVMTLNRVCLEYEYVRNTSFGEGLFQSARVCFNSEFFLAFKLFSCIHFIIMKFDYQDIEPPKFTTCPGIIFGYTGRNSLEGQALWVIPTATDNHDHAINTSWSEPLYPNKVLEPGTYTVTYTAEDSAGNKALPCVTKVVIKGKTITIEKRSSSWNE